MLPATRRDRSTTRMPSSGAAAFGSNSMRGIIACSLATAATLVPDAGGPQGLKRESADPRIKPEGKAAAPATVRGEPGLRCVPLPAAEARRRDRATTREPGDRPASRLRACLGRGVPVQRG